MNSGSRHLSSAACFLQSQPRSHKKTRAPCGGGLNPILRGDELEGEELQNNDGPLAPPTFLHAVTSVAIVQWTVGTLSGFETGPILLSSHALYTDNTCAGGDYPPLHCRQSCTFHSPP